MEVIFMVVIGGLAASFAIMGAIMSAGGRIDRYGPPSQLEGPNPVGHRFPRFRQRPEGEVRVVWETGLGRPHMEHMLLQLALPARLPAVTLRPHQSLLGVGDAFEDRFVVAKGGAADAMLGPEARRRLLALATQRNTWQGLVSMEIVPDSEGDSALAIRKEGYVPLGAEVDQLVDTICALSHELLEHWDAPWLAALERWPMGALQRGEDGERRLAGQLDRSWVELEEEHGRWAHSTLLTVSVPGTGGLSLAHRETVKRRQRAQGINTGNPVLDMLVHVEAEDAERARAILQDEVLTDRLLPVIHGRSATLEREVLSLRLPDHPRDLQGPLEELLALAEALLGRLDALEASGP